MQGTFLGARDGVVNKKGPCPPETFTLVSDHRTVIIGTLRYIQTETKAVKRLEAA